MCSTLTGRKGFSFQFHFCVLQVETMESEENKEETKDEAEAEEAYMQDLKYLDF